VAEEVHNEGGNSWERRFPGEKTTMTRTPKGNTIALRFLKRRDENRPRPEVNIEGPDLRGSSKGRGTRITKLDRKKGENTGYFERAKPKHGRLN